MNAKEVLNVIVLGIVSGMVGQGIRAIAGMKKKYDEVSKDYREFKNWFNKDLLLMSLMIGGIAGALGSISFLEKEAIDKQTVLALITIGYAGTDFIEGFMKRKLPD